MIARAEFSRRRFLVGAGAIAAAAALPVVPAIAGIPIGGWFTLTDTAGLMVGMTVAGDGIPAGACISSISAGCCTLAAADPDAVSHNEPVRSATFVDAAGDHILGAS